MAFGRSSGGTARSTSGAVGGPFAEDRQVEIRVHGNESQRIGFEQADVAAPTTDAADRGFIAKPGEPVRFILAAGDELWANGDADSLDDALSILITKAGA